MFSSRTTNRRRRAVEAANRAKRDPIIPVTGVVERVQAYTVEPDSGGQARAAAEQAKTYPGAPWGVR